MKISRNRHQRAFTMISMLLVVIIISILSTIVFNLYVKRINTLTPEENAALNISPTSSGSAAQPHAVLDRVKSQVSDINKKMLDSEKELDTFGK